MKLLDHINNSDKFYIYGAQVVAYGAYKAIDALCGRRPEAFVVSSMEGNPSVIDGLPVITLQQMEQEALSSAAHQQSTADSTQSDAPSAHQQAVTEPFFLVAVTELLHEPIRKNLEENGHRNYCLFTQAREHELMAPYYERLGVFPVLKESGEAVVPSIAHDDFILYEVKNHRDKPLAKHPELYPYEASIQAGVATADKKIAPIGDDTGVNISARNLQYCEMSAAYWVWKNTAHPWVGIEHYRRHLLIKPEQLGPQVDAVLPLPYMCYPNTLAQFRRFVPEEVVEALLSALRHLHPEQFEAYESILKGPYQYTYNLSCTRREVYEDYCSWFFEITEYMEAQAPAASPIHTTRALSYVAEVLTNLYFMHNAKGWRIYHVAKEIYT